MIFVLAAKSTLSPFFVVTPNSNTLDLTEFLYQYKTKQYSDNNDESNTWNHKLSSSKYNFNDINEKMYFNEIE